MQFNNYLKRKMPFLAILGLLFGLSSCGSYQYVGVDNDGIYGTSEIPVQQEEETVVAINTDSQNNYYQNYFKTKSLEYQNMADDAVFTDIDSYVGSNYVENDSINNNYQGYAGWGQSNSNVIVNVNSGWGGYGGWNIGFGWGYGGYYGGYPGWGWGGYYPGWGYPGWGYPGWCYPGYGYPGYGYYRSPYVSYSASRRGSYYSRGYSGSQTGRRSSYGTANTGGRRSSYASNNSRTSATGNNSSTRRSSINSNNRTTSKYNTTQ